MGAPKISYDDVVESIRGHVSAKVAARVHRRCSAQPIGRCFEALQG